jgi:hypothetical protein
MAEMKYLRDGVNTLPTGPAQGVAASLQTSNEIPEPSSQSPSEEKIEVDGTNNITLYPPGHCLCSAFGD